MTCSGKCCERFHLPFSDREIRSIRAMIELYPHEAEKWRDIFYIASMVIPLGDEYFTCKHHNKETKLCMAYEERPGLCRGFPYKKKCCYDKNCTDVGSDLASQIPDKEFTERVAKYCEEYKKELWEKTGLSLIEHGD